MPSSFFGANLHSFFFFTKSFYLVNDDFHLCSENRFIQGMSFFYGGSSFEGNSTVWQLHHFRDSSESFDLQSRQLWEQGKRTGSVNTWFSHLSVCNVHSRFFIFFWIKILNSQFHTSPTPHLAKPAKTWLILSTFWAIVLSRENRNWQKFSGKEYGKMIGRWTNWHNIKIVSRKWIWRNDLKMANWHNSIIIFRKRIWKDDAQLCS